MEVLDTVFNSDSLEKCLSRLTFRHPALLVDQVTYIDAGKFLAATKNIMQSESVFTGVANNVYYPATLILESLIQAATILAIHEYVNSDHADTQNLLSGVQNAEFENPVFAGDQLLLSIEAKDKKPYVWLFDTSASTENHIVATATIALKPISPNI